MKILEVVNLGGTPYINIFSMHHIDLSLTRDL